MLAANHEETSTGNGAWALGGHSGKIYCAPLTARSVLVIDPSTSSASLLGDFGAYCETGSEITVKFKSVDLPPVHSEIDSELEDPSKFSEFETGSETCHPIDFESCNSETCHPIDFEIEARRRWTPI